MTPNLTEKDFFAKSIYTEDDLKKASLDWNMLSAIANHHQASLHTLALYGGAIANRIQEFSCVHSVRWRVKNTHSLIEKIIRKNLEKDANQKWKGINLENYRLVVSDLIGVRALHLLKEEWVTVDTQIREVWNVHETTRFKKLGDPELALIIDQGGTEVDHDAGYRSIHYGIKYQPEKLPILVEIQTRTIFQEAWSEIDHKVRYPNFSENELLKYFLITFSGLSANADDMSSFVIMLDELIKSQAASLLESGATLAESVAEVTKLQKEIDKLRVDGKTPKASVKSLQTSVDRIKDNNYHKLDSLVDPGYMSRFAEMLNPLSSLTVNPEIFTALQNVKSQHAAIAEVMQNMIRPSAVVMEQMKNITAQSHGLTAALAAVKNIGLDSSVYPVDGSIFIANTKNVNSDDSEQED